MRQIMRLLAVAGLAVAAGTASAQFPPPHAEDRAWLLQAAAFAASQVAINELAVEKAGAEPVQALASDLLEHYRTTLDAVEELADARDVELVTALDPVTQQRLDELEGLSGAAFDASYLAGEEPALYTEQWVHRRTARHATEAPIVQAAEAAAAPAEARWERTLDLATPREDDLPPGPHPDDSSLLTFTMNLDLAQVALGEMVLDRAQDERVRAFAQKMVRDHGASYDALAEIARSKDVAPLEQPGPLERAVLERLQAMPDELLDLAYMQTQVVFHDNWYKRIEYTAHNGTDPAIVAAAEDGFKTGMAHHDVAY
ncbi:DUF4142 domain-containing protein [Acuticoccus sp.]|uniref:DUF4142 domain-containing protein n=1 Tax=Acuticoccus sp. TaxID=1904378 RepID=UPI003B515EBB